MRRKKQGIETLLRRRLRKQYKLVTYWHDLYWALHDEWKPEQQRLNRQLKEACQERNHWQSLLGKQVDEDRIISGWAGPVMDRVTGKICATPREFIEAIRNRRAIAEAGGVDVREKQEAGIR